MAEIGWYTLPSSGGSGVARRPLRSIATIEWTHTAAAAPPPFVPTDSCAPQFTHPAGVARRSTLQWWRSEGTAANRIITAGAHHVTSVVDDSGRSRLHGSSVTVLGSLKSLEIYRELTGDTSLRAVNDGMLLDSLNSRTAVVAAGATILWFLTSQALQLVGLGALLHRETRRDVATWWLGGAVLTGLGVFTILDVSSFGQLYFLHLALPFGAVLTAVLCAAVVANLPSSTAATYVAGGVAVGAAVSISAVALTASASTRPDFGLLDSVMVPLVFAGSVFVALAVAWWWWRRKRLLPAAGTTISMATPVAAPNAMNVASHRRLLPVPTLSRTEHRSSRRRAGGRLWLRHHSRSDDIVATNSLSTGRRPARVV